ncbi:MAG: TolB family protein [Candidatus Kapaibacterium sp.]
MERKSWDDPVLIANISSSADDFAPVWNPYEKLLYFNSVKDGNSYFYTAVIMDSAVSTPEYVEGPLNKPGSNSSYITFENESRAYFSSFKMYSKGSYLNIYRTNKKKMQWQPPIFSDSLNSPEYNSHPTVSPDGSYMVFSSTRAENSYDTDLWAAHKDPFGEWSSILAINEINSPGNEITPCLISQDTMIFASDGLGGPGGYDLYISVRYMGEWQRPSPLYEINTEYNESDPALLPDGSLVFASDRPGGKGGLDLYRAFPAEDEDIKNIDKKADVSISSLLTNITVKSSYTYRSIPLIPYLNGNELTSYFKNAMPEITGDELYINSFALILQRLKKHPKSRLVFIGGKNEYRSILKKYIFEDRRIEPGRVMFTGEDNSEIISMYSDDADIFAPLQPGERSINITPSLLELFINFRNAWNLNNWELKLNLGPDTIKPVSSEIIRDSSIVINLDNYAQTLWDLSRFSIELNANDNKGGKYVDSIECYISHSETRIRRKDTLDGRLNEYFHIVIMEPSDLRYEKNFEHIFSGIKESARISDGISISYPENNPQMKANAEALKQKLKEKYKINTPAAVESYQQEPGLGYFSKFLLRITIYRII